MRVDLVPLCSFPAFASLIPTVCSEGQHRSSRICFVRVWKPGITQKALTQLIILTRRNLEKHESTNWRCTMGSLDFLGNRIVSRLPTMGNFGSPSVQVRSAP